MILSLTDVKQIVKNIETRPSDDTLFDPARWPRDYACDYVLAHRDDFGVGLAALRRSDALDWMQRNVSGATTIDEVCDILARAYVRENKISVTYCRYCSQPVFETGDALHPQSIGSGGRCPKSPSLVHVVY